MAKRQAKAGFPLEIVAQNPRVMCLPAAGCGILFRLVSHFWLSECRPLPDSNDELFSIARAHRPTWIHWRGEIMSIFNEVAPPIEKRFRTFEMRMRHLEALGVKGNSILALRAAEKRAAKSRFAPTVPTAPLVSQANRAPKAAAGGRSGFSDR